MNKKSLYLKLALLCIVLVYFAYMLKQQNTERLFDHEKYAYEHIIEDAKEYSQDLSYYAEKLPDTSLLSKEQRQNYEEDFYKSYYMPWTQEKSLITLEEMSSVFNRKAPAYAENLKAWDTEKWQQIQDNADLLSYPNTALKAITLRQTPLRAMPSMNPLFLEPQGLSNSYPFDMLQYSHLPLALPLYISHMTKDKAWCFIDTGNASGWVQSKDIAPVDEEFIQNWQEFELAAIVKEESALQLNSFFHAMASIGTLLPMKEGKLYVPVRELAGSTILYHVDIAKENYKNFPLDYTARNVAELGQEMMGQNYGWGGFLANRDCSLMLQDLFIPFAIYLPRNSALQAKVGTVYTFADTKLKEEIIGEKAVPFATLIYKKGHVMLYIGQENEKAMLFHNAWGITAKKNERILIGKALVTSLEVAQENPRAETSKSLLNTIESFNVF